MTDKTFNQKWSMEMNEILDIGMGDGVFSVFSTALMAGMNKDTVALILNKVNEKTINNYKEAKNEKGF
ncbi:MAG TPA: hypothetical protein PK564_02605 [bacterium]|nr:hypothetical protein [bacterium]